MENTLESSRTHRIVISRPLKQGHLLPTENDKLCIRKVDGELKILQAGVQPPDLLEAEYDVFSYDSHPPSDSEDVQMSG